MSYVAPYNDLLHNQTYNNKERRKRSVARNLKTLIVVCSSSNAHKISNSQTCFIQFQGVFVSGEKVIAVVTLSIVAVWHLQTV